MPQKDDSVFPTSVLLLDSNLLTVALLRLRRFRLSRLDLGKTPLVLLLSVVSYLILFSTKSSLLLTRHV